MKGYVNLLVTSGTQNRHHISKSHPRNSFEDQASVDFIYGELQRLLHLSV